MAATPTPAVSSFGLDATVEQIAAGVAQLKLADGQAVRWPADRLPTGSEVGSRVTLTALSDQARTQLARALANDLLDVGSTPPAP